MTKHIGIVACSAEGAALCYQTICREGTEYMGEHKHPEISMHTFPLSEYMDRIYVDDWSGVAELMIASGRKLQQAGADFLICPDNTIHQSFNLVLKESSLPWLHIADEVAWEATAQGYIKSGILGTKYLMTGPVYPGSYDQSGLEYLIPEEQDREQVDAIIFTELVYGLINRSSKAIFLDIIEKFKQASCDSVVLGCTEIPLIVLPGESPLPVLDSTRILARAALKESLKGDGPLRNSSDIC